MSVSRTPGSPATSRGVRVALGVIAGALGLAAAMLLIWGIWASMATFEGYSPLRHFISLLALPSNPDGHKLDQGFMFGGGLAAASLAITAATTRGGRRRAASCGAASALSLAGVGAYPITDIEPHMVFAGLCGVLLIAALWIAARDLDRRAAAFDRARTKLALHACRSALWATLGLIAMAIGYLAYIAIDMDASTLTEIYRGLPRGMLYVTDGGRVINPITVAEWVYFALAVLVLAAYSVAAMWPARALAPLSDVARRP